MASLKTKALILSLLDDGVVELNDIWREVRINYNYLIYVMRELLRDGYVVKVGKGKYKITEKGRRLLDLF